MNMQFRPANDNEKIECDYRTYAAWGKPLSRQEFAERERRLGNCRWIREGGTTWVAEQKGQLFASCETMKMISRFRDELGRTYGIASVFTDERHRGLGYASAMLRSVMQQIQARDPKAQAFILYSEVGASIYERLGFQARPTKGWVAQASAEASASKAIPGENVGDLLDAYNAIADEFRILPSLDQHEWFWEREALYSECLAMQRPAFRVLQSGPSFSTWTADYKHSIFRALVFSAQSTAQACDMLERARVEAARIGLRAVEVWNTPATRLEPTRTLELRELDATLPMIRPAEALNSRFQSELWQEIPRVLWV